MSYTNRHYGNMKMALRWGIAGAGLMSHDFVTALMTLPACDHHIVAIGGKNLEKSNDFKVLHNIKNALASYEAISKDKTIDIVYVACENPEHYRITKMMLNEGKSVLCEKPMGLTTAEMKELTDLATAKRVFLMEGIWSRFFPAYQALDSHIQSGGLGDVLQVNVSFGVKTTPASRGSMQNMGGGVIRDLGIYALQFAQLVYKEEPIKVVCGGHIGDHGIDESMSCVLLYSQGRTATLSTHFRVNMPNEAHVVGTKGSIRLNSFWAPTVFKASAADITEWQLPRANKNVNFFNSTGLSYEAEECRRCIKLGLLESPRMTHADSLALMALEEEIRRQLNVTS